LGIPHDFRNPYPPVLAMVDDTGGYINAYIYIAIQGIIASGQISW
jgi:xanthosine utilization system XapX-like protein